VRPPYASPKSERQRCGAAVGAIVATLSGSDTASTEGIYGSAEGIYVTSPSPILALCRALIEIGIDQALPLVAVRGQTVCLKIRSIGEGARLEINAYGTGFRLRRGADAGSPAAPNAHRARRAA
jgi:hypothetical protein